MWNDLVGSPAYATGAAGTATIPKGALVIGIVAHATSAGSMTLFGGASVPIPAGETLSLRFNHTLWQSRNNAVAAGSQDIVFTSTDSYYVEYVTRP